VSVKKQSRVGGARVGPAPTPKQVTVGGRYNLMVWFPTPLLPTVTVRTHLLSSSLSAGTKLVRRAPFVWISLIALA
jgi:hypothetical protein